MNIQQISKEPCIEVGILTASSLRFEIRMPFRCGGLRYPAGRYGIGLISDGQDNSVRLLSLDAGEWLLEYESTPLPHQTCFTLENVCIGIGFHWQRHETQSFEGRLKLLVHPDGTTTAVNVIALEQYLYSVIASEMKASNGLELLKAHAVVSRSWLLAQWTPRDENGQRIVPPARSCGFDTEDTHIRWYERDAHREFDVCADDHCQRYQGLGKVDCPQVREAIEATRGEVLCDGNAVCDARFHKCCGGMTERFDSCWAEGEAPYLQSVRDGKTGQDAVDLSRENEARDFILNPPISFCQTDNPVILKQIFNNYDQETPHFYRWTLRYSQQELSLLLKEKSGFDFGRILSMEAFERGPSGRIVRLRIIGEKKVLIIGKELEIRKSLSKSHLYSSAFTVEYVFNGKDEYPSEFILHGAGWGHGVGMCQVGAAVMASEGYGYRQILQHYYPQNKLKKIYG